MHLRRLFIAYLSALALLFACVLASALATDREAVRIVTDAQLINTAARQRMLSQRIAYLVETIVSHSGHSDENARAELSNTFAELNRAIAFFAETHRDLARTFSREPRIDRIFTGEGREQPSLNARVEIYLSHARAVLSDPEDHGSLDALLSVERAGLLNELDRVVSEVEAISVARVGVLRRIGSISLIASVIIISLAIAFVFLPGHRLIRSTIGRLKEQNADLKMVHQESEALRAEQAEFTYSVSHDLKSPANTVWLVLSELRDEHGDVLPESARELLEQGIATVDRMGAQIEDILKYAWATNRRDTPTQIDMANSVACAFNALQPLLERTGARLETTVATDFFGYEDQVRMLLQNLIENALIYQPEGQRPRVMVEVMPLPGRPGARITVTDNGIGIAAGDHAKVFGLFQRLHLRSVYPGTGLGLATCRRIAANHGGRITVSSTPGKGTVFEAILGDPVSKSDHELTGEAA